MKLLAVFMGGLALGIFGFVLVEQVQNQSQITVNKIQYEEDQKKLLDLSREVKTLKEKLLENEKTITRINTLILEREKSIENQKTEIEKLKDQVAAANPDKSPEKIKQKLVDVKAKFDKAFEKLDKEEVLDALKEALDIGPEAYKLAVELWRKIYDDYNSGGNKLKLMQTEYYMMLQSSDFLKWVLFEPGIDKALKIWSSYGLPWADPKNAPDILATALQKETDQDIQRYLIDNLIMIPSKKGEKVLIDSLYKTADGKIQKRIIFALSQNDSEDSTKALKDFSFSQNTEIAEAAKAAMVLQNPPVSGWGITTVYGDSQHGIKEGDIIISYDKHEIKSRNQLYDLTQKSSGKENISIEIYRNGKLEAIVVKGGRLGIEGRYVKPKN